MRSTTLSLLLGAGIASAQISLPSSIFGLPFSPQCQGAVLQVLTNGSFAQCFPTTDLLPLLTSNSSIVPVLDNFMTDFCYNVQPCSNDTLQQAAQTVLAGCASDLAAGRLPNSTVTTAFSIYPLLREVLCLKTIDPYTSESYGGFLGEPPIPINEQTYNSTDGYFCVTSFLTQLTAYFGTNATVPYIASIVSGQNSTALNLLTSINPNILCNECLFGALEVVEAAYPAIGNIELQTIANYAPVVGLPVIQAPNTTINGLFNLTCAYEGLSVSTNGTLPESISVSIVNSTFPYPITDGSATAA